MVTQEPAEFVSRDDFDRRNAEVDRRFDGIDRRLDSIDRRLDTLTDRVDRLTDKFEGIYNQFRRIDDKFQGIDDRILAATAASEDRIRREMRWGFGVLLAVVVTLFSVAMALRG